MYTESRMNNKLIPFFAIIFSALLFFLQHASTSPPQAKSIDSPLDEFSAERAFETLKYLLQENKPHPVGSELNKIIKERLITELDKLEIDNHVQKTFDISFIKFPSLIKSLILNNSYTNTTNYHS